MCPPFFFFFWDKPDWDLWYRMAFKLLILLSLSHDYRCESHACWCNWIQGLTQISEAFYQLIYIPSHPPGTSPPSHNYLLIYLGRMLQGVCVGVRMACRCRFSIHHAGSMDWTWVLGLMADVFTCHVFSPKCFSSLCLLLWPSFFSYTQITLKTWFPAFWVVCSFLSTYIPWSHFIHF